MKNQLTVMISGGFGEGHAYPALALGRALRRRGHTVVVELSERWRSTVAREEMTFTPTADYIGLPSAVQVGGAQPTVLDRLRELETVIAEHRPDVIVADLVAPAPALAAELAGVPLATLIPVPFPIQGQGLPPFEQGLAPPRTSLGRLAWRALVPALRPVQGHSRWLREVGGLLNQTRARVGLPPLEEGRALTTYGTISEELALVATFPQLEYPRSWPESVRITGPMTFDLTEREVELPSGQEPLVLVAGSTVHDNGRLVTDSLAALAGEPVRGVVSLNRRGARWPGACPTNVTVVDWASYAPLMPRAALVVTSGGHGTVTRALASGSPVLVCPVAADAAENGARVAWAGAGLMLPRALLRPRTLRLAVRAALAEPALTDGAQRLAVWARANDGAEQAATAIETLSERDHRPV